jgi:hypothetical protein
VKARLTALAIETVNFSRDDIYTLFVTTRILDFLKGLHLSRRAHLDSLFDKQWTDRRTAVGFEALKRLRETGRLNFWTHQGWRENKRFRPELFFRVLAEAGAIGCLNGQRIIVGEFSAPQAAQKDSEARRAVFVVRVRDSCSSEHEHGERPRFSRGD